MLTIPVQGERFVVFTNARGIGLGCVLMQHWKAVSYDSRQIKSPARRCLTHDLELAAIVFTLKVWRHYLFGEHVELYTDHKSLKYLFSQRE